MSRSERIRFKVWKVWSRYGALKATPMLGFPDLPYLPHRPPTCTHPHTHTRARARAYASVFFSMEGMEGMEKLGQMGFSSLHTSAIGMERVWK